MSATRVFASFDVVRDADLYQRLVAESGDADLGIIVSGGSEAYTATLDWNDRTRTRIRGAERILVICGEQTDASIGVAAELRIAQEERKPYLLLWGRRDLMCTKPIGARASEGMYTWTSPTLQEQFAVMSRAARRKATAKEMRRGECAQTGAHGPAS